MLVRCPTAPPAKMTGCRHSNSFDWVRGSSQARPLPWALFGHVISERKTFLAIADREGCILQHSMRTVKGFVGHTGSIQERA